jgi:hypothetical protein
MFEPSNTSDVAVLFLYPNAFNTKASFLVPSTISLDKIINNHTVINKATTINKSRVFL